MRNYYKSSILSKKMMTMSIEIILSVDSENVVITFFQVQI